MPATKVIRNFAAEALELSASLLHLVEQQVRLVDLLRQGAERRLMARKHLAVEHLDGSAEILETPDTIDIEGAAA